MPSADIRVNLRMDVEPLRRALEQVGQAATLLGRSFAQSNQQVQRQLAAWDWGREKARRVAAYQRLAQVRRIG
jgi:hypothetical protein